MSMITSLDGKPDGGFPVSSLLPRPISAWIGFVLFVDLVYLCAMNELEDNKGLKPVRITAMRQTVYHDLMARFENPIEHACDITIGQQFIAVNGKRPDGLCESAWESMRSFVEALARGEGNFYDGWMQNPCSAMISCNDGFRPVSFYLEALDSLDHLKTDN